MDYHPYKHPIKILKIPMYIPIWNVPKFQGFMLIGRAMGQILGIFSHILYVSCYTYRWTNPAFPNRGILSFIQYIMKRYHQQYLNLKTICLLSGKDKFFLLSRVQAMEREKSSHLYSRRSEFREDYCQLEEMDKKFTDVRKSECLYPWPSMA